MDILALVRDGARQAAALSAEGGEGASEPFQINLFWIIVAATTFILFFFLIREFALAGLQKTLDGRRERIEQGLKDAEQARSDRESAEQERLTALQEARREANEIINRAQKVAAEMREQDIAATRDELTRLKERAAAEIEGEKQRAIAELRGEVTDLADPRLDRVEAGYDESQRWLVIHRGRYRVVANLAGHAQLICVPQAQAITLATAAGALIIEGGRDAQVELAAESAAIMRVG